MLRKKINAMTYKLHFPAPPLGHFINSFTYYKGYQPEHRIDRFLPDGHIELVIDLTDTPKNLYDNESLLVKQAFRKAWISGLRREYISIHSGQDAEMFVIQFRRGMAYPFLKMPLSEIAEQVLETDVVFGRPILALREQLVEAHGPEAKFLLAEAHLQALAGDGLTANPFIEYAVEHIIQKPGQLSLEQLSQKVGFSQKHLIHLFKMHLGLPPKAFLRIMRFQSAILKIEQGGGVNWVHLALDCGYYDQAHFIRDFRAFSGFSPEEYLLRKGYLLNYVPVG